MDLFADQESLSAFNTAVKDVGCVLAGIRIIGDRLRFTSKCSNFVKANFTKHAD